MNESGGMITHADIDRVVRKSFDQGRCVGYLDGVAAGKVVGAALRKRRIFWLRVVAAGYGALLGTLGYGVVQIILRGGA